LNPKKFLAVVIIISCQSIQAIEYEHGYAFLKAPEYAAGFKHFKYVNPDAPKGGEIRLAEQGTWDNFNPVANRGRTVHGAEFWFEHRRFVWNSLMRYSQDEPASMYCVIAEGVAHAKDFSWVAFKLREQATWNDGEPITVEDIIFSFETYLRPDISPSITSLLRIVQKVEKIGPREVKFHITEQGKGDPFIPLRLGVTPIMAKHYWAERDITKTTVEPPIGSGPYKVGDFRIGRWVKYERVKDHWSENLNIGRGMYNFDTIKVDYFRDDQVRSEAVKSHVIDFNMEDVPKTWENGYDTVAYRKGLLKKNQLLLARPSGLWWPLMWNLEQPRFQDIRVREALWLQSDFEWGSKRSYGMFDFGVSYFHGSDLAATGLPSKRELKFLEPLRERIPAKVFTHEYTGQPNQGRGWSRENLLRSDQLLRAAGWVVKDGKRVHNVTGEAFNLSLVAISPALGRAWIPTTQKLKRLGISSSIKAPELSNWLYRHQSGDFDGGSITFLPDNIPTGLAENSFLSNLADQPYSYNWINMKDPAVDALINHMKKAESYDDYVAAARALDRVMLWNYYQIPSSSKARYNIVHWDKYGVPEHGKLLRETEYQDIWWWDEEKAANVEAFTGVR